MGQEDLREKGGVTYRELRARSLLNKCDSPRMPFTWTVSQTYMQMTIKLSELQPNVPIDATRFAKPHWVRYSSRFFIGFWLAAMGLSLRHRII